MRKDIHLLFSFIIFVFLNCSLALEITNGENRTRSSPGKSGLRERQIVFKEELSIGAIDGDEKYIFHQPFDLKVDDQGNIYILDSGNFRIQKFDRNGKYISSIGRKGQGPGEFLNCQDLDLDRDANLWIFDPENNRISGFTPEGKYANSIKLEFPPRFGAIDSENNIYVYEQYKGKLIHKYDTSGKIVCSFMDEIKFEPKRAEPHVNGLGRIAVHDDKIFLSMIYPYTIYVFSKQGELLKKMSKKVPYSKPPFISPEGVVITNFIITGLSISPNGTIFNKATFIEIPKNWKEKIGEITSHLFDNSFIDVFDSAGSHLFHYKSPGLTWSCCFDMRGYFYAIEEDAKGFFKVVKYSITFK